FFQAEDGIRDGHVTGVQTCALPICCIADSLHGAQSAPRQRVGKVGRAGVVVGDAAERQRHFSAPAYRLNQPRPSVVLARGLYSRSEERRVGKERMTQVWEEYSSVDR